MELIFQNPRNLYILLLIPLLIFINYITLKSSKKKAIPFANFEALSRISKKYVFVQNNVQLLIRILIIIAFCMIFAGPELHYQKDNISPNTLILLDASDSMLVYFNEITPFSLSEQFIQKYYTMHTYKSSLSLVTYSTISKIIVSPTHSSLNVNLNLNRIQPHKIGGSDLGTALHNAFFLLNTQKGSKRIILITDGKTSFGSSIEESLELIIKNNIKIDIVLFNLDGEIPIRQTLINLADSTGGLFIEQKEVTEKLVNEIMYSENTYVIIELEKIILLVGLIILILEWMMLKTIFRFEP
jgi:hypothetical protein